MRVHRCGLTRHIIGSFIAIFVFVGCANGDETVTLTSVNGVYNGLVQTLYCPSDFAEHGQFKDYGYWAGGNWCGQQAQSGYWVWVNPNWYVWQNTTRTASSDGRPAVYNYDGGGGYVGGEKCSYASAGGTTVKVCD